MIRKSVLFLFCAYLPATYAEIQYQPVSNDDLQSIDLPKENPFSVLRNLIKEKGNATRSEVEAIANSVAPLPDAEKKKAEPEKIYDPTGYMLFKQPGQSLEVTGDDPYLFGLDNESKAKEIMQYRYPREQVEEKNPIKQEQRALDLEPAPDAPMLPVQSIENQPSGK